MRRILIFVGTVTLSLTLAAPAGAAGPLSARPHGSARTFCRNFDDLLGVLRTAKQPSALKKPHAAKVLDEFETGAPQAIRGPVKTVADSFAHARDHGRKSLTRRQNDAANRAMAATASFAGKQCPDSKMIQRFAAVLSIAGPIRAAQSNLRNALTNAKAIYTDSDTYLSASAAALAEAEPSLSFTDGPTDPTSVTSISVNPISAHKIVLAAGTGSKCLFIRDSIERGTKFAMTSGSACDAHTPPAAWSDRW